MGVHVGQREGLSRGLTRSLRWWAAPAPTPPPPQTRCRAQSGPSVKGGGVAEAALKHGIHNLRGMGRAGAGGVHGHAELGPSAHADLVLLPQSQVPSGHFHLPAAVAWPVVGGQAGVGSVPRADPCRVAGAAVPGSSGV